MLTARVHATILFAAATAMGAGPVSIRAQRPSVQAGRVLFERVTVIQPDAGGSPAAVQVREAVWVGVEEGRFVIISDREPAGWSDALRISGDGRFLVPGLVDMHVHPNGREDLEALLVHGVTTARLGRGNPTHLRWRDGVRDGVVRGPNLVVGSPNVWDRGPAGFGVPTPDEASVRDHVRRFQSDGYDIVKLVDVYDHRLAEALFDEARILGIPVFGHVADDATVPFDWDWTAGLGYRTLEHLDEVVRLALPSGATDSELDAFVDIARRHDIAFTSLLGPMLWRARAHGRALEGRPAYTAEDEARAFVVSGGNGRSRLRGTTVTLSERSPSDLSASMPDTALVMRAFARLSETGVTIVPGTEGASPVEWAGATLHDELEIFVRGGMIPLRALRAATVDAASLLDAESITGAIEIGAVADALMVTDDPRQGLGGLRSPWGVMVAGRWYGPDTLAEMRRLFGLGNGGDAAADRATPGGSTVAGDPLNGAGSATHPAISPDGGRIAFMSNTPGVEAGVPINFEIYVMDGEGQHPDRLTTNRVFDADISWSPDGRRIAFKRTTDGDDEIHVMGADGSDVVDLTALPGDDHAPHWSPDGTRIAFASDRDGTPDIFIMDTAGARASALISSEHSESSPRWSPDGRRIAFVSDRAGSDDVFVALRDGSEVRRLTRSPDSDWHPRWSPDGREILYVSGSFEEDRFDLWAVPSDGSEDPRLVVRDVDSGNPSWHPSGSCIVIGRYVDGRSRLFVLRPDGFVLERLDSWPATACRDREGG